MYFLFDFGWCSMVSVKSGVLVTKLFVEIPLIKYLYSLSNLKHFILKKRIHICDAHLKNVVYIPNYPSQLFKLSPKNHLLF